MASTTDIHAAQRFTRAPSLVAREYVPELSQLTTMPARDAAGTAETEKNCAVGIWDANFGTAGKSFVFAAGRAVVPIYGSLLHKDNWCLPWATGYDYIASRVGAAAGDPDVEAIILDINSYGGHVAGNFELAEMIREVAQTKPVYAIVDARALSGGYSLAAAATKIFATPSAEIGSIGVLMMHMSHQKALDEMGLKPTFIFAGDHKVDGNPYQDLPDDVREAMQASVNKSYEQFVSLVAASRQLDPEVVRGTQARVMEADEAKSLGLIDEVMSPRAAYAAITAELRSGSTPTKEAKKMTTENSGKTAAVEGDDTARLTAEAKTQGAKEAQTRIAGILQCEEANGKTKLANHLAFNTNMSVEDAKEALKVAASEGAPQQTAEGPLSAAMKDAANKTAGVDGGNGGDGEEEGKKVSASARILANAKAQGVRVRSQH